jgi:hypothetical protein
VQAVDLVIGSSSLTCVGYEERRRGGEELLAIMYAIMVEDYSYDKLLHTLHMFPHASRTHVEMKALGLFSC